MSGPAWQSRQASGYVRKSANSKSTNRKVLKASRKPEMKTKNDSTVQMLGLSAKPAWAQTWHLWKVFIPRRSITGRLVVGKVWRRHDGRRWIYKRFAEYFVECGSQSQGTHAKREEG